MGDHDRRSIPRPLLKVTHRHRIGSRVVQRVSELMLVAGGQPRAVLEWVDLGGVRTPLYFAELDPAKLHRSPRGRHTYYYDGETVDPRYLDVAASPTA
jgi:hypothetical protein